LAEQLGTLSLGKYLLEFGASPSLNWMDFVGYVRQTAFQSAITSTGRALDYRAPTWPWAPIRGLAGIIGTTTLWPVLHGDKDFEMGVVKLLT
jgi:hypothetical protein